MSRSFNGSENYTVRVDPTLEVARTEEEATPQLRFNGGILEQAFVSLSLGQGGHVIAKHTRWLRVPTKSEDTPQ